MPKSKVTIFRLSRLAIRCWITLRIEYRYRRKKYSNAATAEHISIPGSSCIANQTVTIKLTTET